jgi:hypothetical protein
MNHILLNNVSNRKQSVSADQPNEQEGNCNTPSSRDRPIWVQPIPIPIYVPCRYFCQYRYRYIGTEISATDTDTDTNIFPQPIFGRYKPIFWPISRIFYRYLADTDIADIYLADADADTDTDMPIPISSLPIPIYRYRYRYRPNISANRYIGLSLPSSCPSGCSERKNESQGG